MFLGSYHSWSTIRFSNNVIAVCVVSMFLILADIALLFGAVNKISSLLVPWMVIHTSLEVIVDILVKFSCGKSVQKCTELCFPGFPDHLLWCSFFLDGRLSDSQPCQLCTTGILHTHCLSTLQAIDCRYTRWRIFSCLHSQQGTVDLEKRYMTDCQVSLKVSNCKDVRVF